MVGRIRKWDERTLWHCIERIERTKWDTDFGTQGRGTEADIQPDLGSITNSGTESAKGGH